MTRLSPIPPADRTIHVVGDLQGMTLPGYVPRANLMLTDLHNSPTVPDVPYRIQVGDFVADNGFEYPTGREFMDAMGSGQWWATIGNHDLSEGRTPEVAADLMGMPGPNFVVDLGHSVLVVLYCRAIGTPAERAPDLDWLEDVLDAHSDRKVLILSHPPFRFSVPNNAAQMQAVDDVALKAIIDARPQVKAWICGHSHNNLREPLVQTLNMGTRSIMQVNGSALGIIRPNDSRNHLDEVASLYLTVYDDRFEVRFRDHGARQWVLGSRPQRYVQTVPMPA